MENGNADHGQAEVIVSSRAISPVRFGSGGARARRTRGDAALTMRCHKPFESVGHNTSLSTRCRIGEASPYA